MGLFNEKHCLPKKSILKSFFKSLECLPNTNNVKTSKQPTIYQLTTKEWQLFKNKKEINVKI